MDRLPVLSEVKCLFAIARFQHDITAHFKNVARQLPDRILVFNEQDGFIASRPFRQGGSARGYPRGRGRPTRGK